MKWYYLVQLAFWLQQILVVNVEEKRKDYAQMFTHHIITSALVIFSYAYYQTKVGNTILCLMDIVDILLPVCITEPDAMMLSFILTVELRPPNCSVILSIEPHATLPLEYLL